MGIEGVLPPQRRGGAEEDAENALGWRRERLRERRGRRGNRDIEKAHRSGYGKNNGIFLERTNLTNFRKGFEVVDTNSMSNAYSYMTP